jgi:hypothetical protein
MLDSYEPSLCVGAVGIMLPDLRAYTCTTCNMQMCNYISSNNSAYYTFFLRRDLRQLQRISMLNYLDWLAIDQWEQMQCLPLDPTPKVADSPIQVTVLQHIVHTVVSVLLWSAIWTTGHNIIGYLSGYDIIGTAREPYIFVSSCWNN